MQALARPALALDQVKLQFRRVHEPLVGDGAVAPDDRTIVRLRVESHLRAARKRSAVDTIRSFHCVRHRLAQRTLEQRRAPAQSQAFMAGLEVHKKPPTRIGSQCQLRSPTNRTVFQTIRARNGARGEPALRDVLQVGRDPEPRAKVAALKHFGSRLLQKRMQTALPVGLTCPPRRR